MRYYSPAPPGHHRRYAHYIEQIGAEYACNVPPRMYRDRLGSLSRWPAHLAAISVDDYVLHIRPLGTYDETYC